MSTERATERDEEPKWWTITEVWDCGCTTRRDVPFKEVPRAEDGMTLSLIRRFEPCPECEDTYEPPEPEPEDKYEDGVSRWLR